MKLLTLIWALYVLMLPCMPCMDAGVCGEQAMVSVTASTDQHAHGNEDEACAPFCNCSCCGQIVGSGFHVLKITPVNAAVAKKLPSYYNSISLPSDHFGNIWQPPRVS